MADKRLTWAEWQKKANSSYVKGDYGVTQMIRDWGYPKDFDSSQYKIEFDKGRVKRKDRSTRQRHRNEANAARNKLDQVSTIDAAIQRRKLEQSIKQEADSTLLQYAFENNKPILEHNVALHDQAHENGIDASGDPTNLSKSDPQFKIQKDTLESINRSAGNPVVVTVNEISGESRLIPRKYFDPIVDPSKLPGVDIPLDVDPKISFVQALSKMPAVKGLNGAIRFVAGATPVVGAFMDGKALADGVNGVKNGNGNHEKIVGAFEAAGGTLGLASIGMPALIAPSVVLSATAGAIKTGPKPATQIDELFPTAKPVMANTPTGVAQLTKKSTYRPAGGGMGGRRGTKSR